MPYIDEEILEAKRKQEHQKYTTLETGMYAGDELITLAFTNKSVKPLLIYSTEHADLTRTVCFNARGSKAGKISVAGRTRLYFYQFRFHSKYLY